MIAFFFAGKIPFSLPSVFLWRKTGQKSRNVFSIIRFLLLLLLFFFEKTGKHPETKKRRVEAYTEIHGVCSPARFHLYYVLSTFRIFDRPLPRSIFSKMYVCHMILCLYICAYTYYIIHSLYTHLNKCLLYVLAFFLHASRPLVFRCA